MGVLRQHTVPVPWFGLPPRFASGGELLGRNFQREPSALRIDRDPVTVLDQCQRAAVVSFRRDVADDEAVRATGEAATVMSATSWPSPCPMIAEVGPSISRMPGPPRGPS